MKCDSCNKDVEALAPMEFVSSGDLPVKRVSICYSCVAMTKNAFDAMSCPACRSLSDVLANVLLGFDDYAKKGQMSMVNVPYIGDSHAADCPNKPS